MKLTAQHIINWLKLKPHPEEGGFYSETYRSRERIPTGGLPSRYASERSMGTAIYYLLTAETFSAMHRLRTDEIFHFYLGDPVTMLQLAADGSSKVLTMGTDILNDQQLQVVVPRDTWQGSFLNPGGNFALLGCSMAPGFEFEDYEHGARETLLRSYPNREELILRLTK
jgi:predicted cupin superfamily sugar epimerase